MSLSNDGKVFVPKMKVYIVLAEIGGCAEVALVTVDRSKANRKWRKLVRDNVIGQSEGEMYDCWGDKFGDLERRDYPNDEIMYDRGTKKWYVYNQEADYCVHIREEWVKDLV